MIGWIKKIFGSDPAEALRRAAKREAAAYLDAILVEGQGMSKDKIDAWFKQKRADIQAWSYQ